MKAQPEYDFVVVGSGFGGSVAALRLTEKGYRVLVLERGRRFRADDFPKTNWDLKNWMWVPELNWRGIFKMTFFRHVTVLSGVGVGGGSLVYANTLPIPKNSFFEGGTWAGLKDWKAELMPFYEKAQKMLGSTPNPKMTPGDHLLKEIASDLGKSGQFHMTDVAVYFGTPGETVDDPFFDGEGPTRTGCTFCGGCMTGCRFNAKNTLDQNYLYLAEAKGARIVHNTSVEAVRPQAEGYALECAEIDGWFARTSVTYTAKQVVFAGGVLGTLPLLLRMREDPDGLPRLSHRLGDNVRTNNESLIGIVAPASGIDFSEGIAITSILHTGDDSHVEPVRYSGGSGFFRLLIAPHAPGKTLPHRIAAALRGFARNPKGWARVLFSLDFARNSQILLYMRTHESTLRFRLGRSIFTGFRRGLVTEMENGAAAPLAFMAEATDIAERFAEKTGGVTMNLLTETLMAIPSTAHILGGCCIGADATEGVIDEAHRVFGYEGLYVVDGSAISANPGVNPSLSITAMAERAMSLIPTKEN